MGQLNSHSDLPSLAGQQLEPPQAIWNRVMVVPPLGDRGRGDGTTPPNDAGEIEGPGGAHGRGFGGENGSDALDHGDTDDVLLRAAAPQIRANNHFAHPQTSAHVIQSGATDIDKSKN